MKAEKIVAWGSIVVMVLGLAACSAQKKSNKADAKLPKVTSPSLVEIYYQAARNGDVKQVSFMLKRWPKLIESKEKDYGLSALHGAIAGKERPEGKTRKRSFFKSGKNKPGKNKSPVEKKPVRPVRDEAKALEMVKFLLDWRGPGKEKADVNARSRSGNTPLIEAVAYNRLEIAEYLLTNQVSPADIERKNNAGDTPLHWAAAKGHLDMAKLLLANDPGIKASKNKDLPPLLLEAINKEGQTPLHLAAREGHTEMVQLLLDRKAKVNAVDARDRTPLRLALDRHHEGTVELLRKKGGVVKDTLSPR
jgi:ankyrin repeat protein